MIVTGTAARNLTMRLVVQQTCSAPTRTLSCAVFFCELPSQGWSQVVPRRQLRGRRGAWCECRFACQAPYLVQIGCVWNVMLGGRRRICNTGHLALDTPHSTDSTLDTPHATLCKYALYSLYNTLHLTLDDLHCKLYTPHSILFTFHFTLRTLHFTACILHSTL